MQHRKNLKCHVALELSKIGHERESAKWRMDRHVAVSVMAEQSHNTRVTK